MSEDRFLMGEGRFEFDGEDITKYLRDVTFDSEVDSDGGDWVPSLDFGGLIEGSYEPFDLYEAFKLDVGQDAHLDIWRRQKHWWSLRRKVERWPIRVVGLGDVDEVGAEFAVTGEPVLRMVWRWQGWFET